MLHPDKSQRFVLQGFDPETGTVCVERCVSIADIVALRQAIGWEAETDPQFRGDYRLEPDELAAVCALCAPPSAPDAIFTGIARWSPLNDVPYLVHTNFELPLMIDGRKPLAVFSDAYPSTWFDEYLATFEPFVRSGTIVRRVIDEPMPALRARHPEWDRVRHVYFALPGEEWRIDAYITLKDGRRSWTDEDERRQGELFGYSDEQNDWWIERRRALRADIA